MYITDKLLSAYEIVRQDGLWELYGATKQLVQTNITREVTFSCNGTSVTFDTTTQIARDWFFPGHLNGELHEPAFTRRLLEVLEEDSVFYDVGANIGYYTLFASEVCQEGSTYAFELSPKFITAMEKSLERNGTTATVVHTALSDTPGEEIHYTDTTVPNISDSSPANSTTTTTTLNKFTAANESPDVIKIDVEGFEYNVLSGSETLFRDGESRRLFVEIHPELLQQYGHSKHEVLDLLDEYGFDYTRFTDHRNETMDIKGDVAPEDITHNTMLECVR